MPPELGLSTEWRAAPRRRWGSAAPSQRPEPHLQSPFSLLTELIDRTCKVAQLILEESERLTLGQELLPAVLPPEPSLMPALAG